MTKDHADLWAAYLTAKVRQTAKSDEDNNDETDEGTQRNDSSRA